MSIIKDPCGLENLSLICWGNALISALYGPLFRWAVYTVHTASASDCTTKVELARLITSMSTRQSSASTLFGMISRRSDNELVMGATQDPMEAFNCIWDADEPDKDVNEIAQIAKSFPSFGSRSNFMRAVRIYLVVSYQCNACGETSDDRRKDLWEDATPQCYLPLPIESNDSVSDALTRYLSPQALAVDEDFRCSTDGCINNRRRYNTRHGGKRRKTHETDAPFCEQAIVTESPEILILQLLRAQFNSSAGLNSRVAIDEEVTIYPRHSADASPVETSYQLVCNNNSIYIYIYIYISIKHTNTKKSKKLIGQCHMPLEKRIWALYCIHASKRQVVPLQRQ